MGGWQRRDDVDGPAGEPLEAAPDAEHLLAAIIDGSVDAIVATDAQGRITLWNACAEHIYGHTAAEAVGRPVALIVPPERADEERHILERVLRGERVTHHETERMRADGSRVAVSLSVGPLRNETGRIVGAAGIARDISLRRAVEGDRALLASLVDASEDAILAVSPRRVILSGNRAAAQMLDVDPARLVGARIEEVLPSIKTESREPHDALERVFGDGATVHADVQRTLPNGRPRKLAVTMTPVRDGDGAVSAGCVVCRDVTEQQRLERRGQQSERIEAIGRLAGGIAHDFNNLLTVISGFAQLAQAGAGAAPVAGELRQIQRAAGRAAELTGRLLDFSRQRTVDPVVVSLTDTVAGVMPMLERLIGDDIRIVARSDEDVREILADRGQIEQVVMNLALNARDAMPDGGTLTIETRSVELAAGHSEEETGLHAGHYACLVVSDTGDGIEPALLDHLFEPFFTTKPGGEGTGLGLATVHGIVARADGAVNVYSEPGRAPASASTFPRAAE